MISDAKNQISQITARTFWALLLFSSLVLASCSQSATPQTTSTNDTAKESDTAPKSRDDGSSGDGSSGDGTSGDEAADKQVVATVKGAPISEIDKGGEITFGLSNDGTGFDTTRPMSPGSIRVLMPMIDTLVSVTEDGSWTENVAESFSSNDDFTEWVIRLRPEVYFHDGVALDAEALEANLEAFRNSLAVGYAFVSVESFEVVDELTLKIILTDPWAAFPHQFTGPASFLVSPETIGTNDSFVGIGPYMFDSWTPGDSARVVANPNYWKDDRPHLDAINFKFFLDSAVKRQAFEAGDIDGYLGPAQSDVAEFKNSDDVRVAIATGESNEYLFLLNTTAEPFDDLAMRKAFAHSVDRQFIVDTFRSGLTEPAYGPFSPDSFWYVETTYPRYDLEKAKELVADYVARGGDPTFEISVEPNPPIVEVVEVIATFLRDAGMDVTVKEIGVGSSPIVALADDFQAISWIQFGNPDPDWMLPFFHSASGFLNWTNLYDPIIDESFEKGRISNDRDERWVAYAQFQHALAEQVSIVWVDHQNGVEAVIMRPELRGIGKLHVLPNGEYELPMQNGTFFNWTDIWLETD